MLTSRCALAAGALALAACAPRAELAFDDVTDAAGLAFERTPTEGMRTLPDRFGGGVCVIDVDGEPPMDLFFALRDQSRLFVANEPLSYDEQSIQRGLADVGDAIGCLAFDAEGDGDDDLLVTGVGGVRFFEAEDGQFEDASARLGAIPSAMYTSAAAGDIDGDGDLDTVVAGFKHLDRRQVESCAPIDCAGSIGAHVPAANLLLIREGEAYVDRAAELAPELALEEPTLVVGLARLEGAGPIDLFVGNDLGNAFRDRALRRSEDGVYRDASSAIGLAYNRGGYGVDTMGWTVGDVDGDGTLDHVTSSFVGDATAVFLCRDGFCEDHGAALGMGATEDTVRWGVALADFDHDGDLDLVDAAGHVYPERDLRALGSMDAFDQPPHAYRNDGDRLALALDAIPAGAHALRGVALVDLDEDGRLDVVFAPASGAPLALRNASTGGHWLRVRLVGRGANRAAAGALVRVRSDGVTHVRAHTVGEGYLGSFDPRIHVGLRSDAPVLVEVRWPDGSTSSVADVAVDRELVIEQ